MPTRHDRPPSRQAGVIAFFALLLTSSVVLDAGPAPRTRAAEVLFTVESITFRSGPFKIVGELTHPEAGGPHPLVIMVHGDGPAARADFARIKETILKAGYATLIWDKPGSGESTGEFNQDMLLAERASILADAILAMTRQRVIDPGRIGLWGISQAGYVMPLALERTDAVRFMIVVGGPGENGIDQTAYLIQRQLVFAGVPDDEARRMEEHFKGLYAATTFEQYIGHARPLYDNPVQRKLGFVSALWDEAGWKPHTPDEEAFFNPMEIVAKLPIPVLAFFGEKDTQVDPVQGAAAYGKALAEAGNPASRVEVIPGADHDLILSETGSLAERSRRSRAGWRKYSPAYLESLETWLHELGPSPVGTLSGDGEPDITGCWEGAPEGRFTERNKQLRLISRKPNGRMAITLIYDLTPRCQVWEYDIDVAVERGAVSWEAHRGSLSKNGTAMTVVKDWRGERTNWNFVRRKDLDGWIRRLAESTRIGYAYEVPEPLDDGWGCADVESVGIDRAVIARFVERITRGEHGDIHSLLIAKDGQIVLESYFATNGKRSGPFIDRVFRPRPHHMASTTKGVLSALCGIAIDHGHIKSVDDPISGHLPAYAGAFSGKKQAITVSHLLTMTPGWAWNQTRYPWTDPRNDAAAMYDQADVIRYVLERPLASDPGSRFAYSNAAPTVLGAVLEQACGMDVDRFAERNLFQPLGISDHPWTRYFDGSLETDGGLALRSRDLAKIGQMFLDGGTWRGRRVVSEEWVGKSTERRISLGGPWGWGYGDYWMQVDLRTERGPVRSYFVPGDGGQLLAVFPELNMVVVLTGGNYGRDAKSVCFSLIRQYILPAVPLVREELGTGAAAPDLSWTKRTLGE
jgi:CubicO group peptidase (beta-lactamase class C family)/dienelactone hydrolase